MSSSDLEIRKTIIYLLYNQAKTDNFIHPNEMRYILKVANDLGFDQTILEEVQQYPEDYNISLPKKEGERMEIMYRLLFLTKFDQQVGDNEIKFIKNLSIKFAIRQDLIQELVDVMKEYIGRLIPPEALLSIIRKYLN